MSRYDDKFTPDLDVVDSVEPRVLYVLINDLSWQFSRWSDHNCVPAAVVYTPLTLQRIKRHAQQTMRALDGVKYESTALIPNWQKMLGDRRGYLMSRRRVSQLTNDTLTKLEAAIETHSVNRLRFVAASIIDDGLRKQRNEIFDSRASSSMVASSEPAVVLLNNVDAMVKRFNWPPSAAPDQHPAFQQRLLQAARGWLDTSSKDLEAIDVTIGSLEQKKIAAERYSDLFRNSHNAKHWLPRIDKTIAGVRQVWLDRFTAEAASDLNDRTLALDLPYGWGLSTAEADNYIEAVASAARGDLDMPLERRIHPDRPSIVPQSSQIDF